MVPRVAIHCQLHRLRKTIKLTTWPHHKEEHSRTQAENVSLKEQLRCYTEMEQELSGALREIAEGDAGGGGGKIAPGDRLGLGSLDKMKTSVEDALLLGTTLAGAPSQVQLYFSYNF